MTDPIKDEVESSSAALDIRIRNGSVKVDKHIQAFRQEMGDLGANDQTLFILFGRPVTRIFQRYLAGSYPNHVRCTHYSMYGTGYTDAEWVAKTWRILEEHYRKTFSNFKTPQFEIDNEMQTELDRPDNRSSHSHCITGLKVNSAAVYVKSATAGDCPTARSLQKLFPKRFAIKLWRRSGI